MEGETFTDKLADEKAFKIACVAFIGCLCAAVLASAIRTAIDGNPRPGAQISVN